MELTFTIDQIPVKNIFSTGNDLYYESPGEDIDLGLRKTILSSQTNNNSVFYEVAPTFNTEHIIYFTEDIYGCHYILFPLPDQEFPLAMVLGPYLQEPPGIQRTQELCKRHNIPQGLLQFLNQYFSSITYMENTSTLEYYIETLSEMLYGNGNFSFEYIKQKEDRDQEYISSADSTSNENTMQMLEHRYKMEEKIMDAVSRGDYDMALHYSMDKAFSGVDNRTTSTLRSKKNNLFVVNTICRKAAERGKVHPVYLDELSRRMAIRIEGMTSPGEDKEVHREMLRRYCMMVRQHSTAGYSPVMQNVLNHISQNLKESSLTLQQTATDLGLNKSYLATLFKKETGSTFTEYVNKKRVDHAIFLLNTTDYPVHNIASICGINDMTYFTRVFRKKKGMTPTQYRNMIKTV
ncbi:MAG: AraC family transcriptional regulator [Butyrivibrio sp.]|nr:AraC family transcriptional regulator [Butyrivibrio sp.]